MGFSDGLQGIDVAAAGTPPTNRGSNEFVVKDVEPGGTLATASTAARLVAEAQSARLAFAGG